RLEMFYDQGNYEIVYRRSNRYLNKPDYDKYPEPAFYKALSTLKISEKGDVKFSPELSISLYREFLALSPDPNFLIAHRNEIADFKSSLQQYAIRLNDLGRKKESERILADLNIIFDEQLQYADIIKLPNKNKNINPD